MPDRRSVALLIETSNAYGRGLLDGIIAYQREHELWSVYVGEHERGARPPRLDEELEAATASSPASRPMRLPPSCGAAGCRPWTSARPAAFPIFPGSRRTIARSPSWPPGISSTAAFANWPIAASRCSIGRSWREERFLAVCAEEGLRLQGVRRPHAGRRRILLDPRAAANEVMARKAAQAGRRHGLLRFPRPAALDVCRELDIAVPEQVAVIGVDNDERLCQLCTPPLSSVIPDSRGAGYEAAQLLDRMMRGEKVPADAMLLSPLGIAERQSSDMYAVDDSDIATALRYIREHACEGISVSDVLRVVPLSRRMLEHRFQKVVRRSPHAEIVRIRMERATRLLRETDLSLADIARRAGFASAIYLSKSFKNYTGVSPRAFRTDGRSVS